MSEQLTTLLVASSKHLDHYDDEHNQQLVERLKELLNCVLQNHGKILSFKPVDKNHVIWFLIFFAKRVLKHHNDQKVQEAVTQLIANLIFVCPWKLNQLWINEDILQTCLNILNTSNLDSKLVENVILIVGNLAKETNEMRLKLYQFGLYHKMISLLHQTYNIPNYSTTHENLLSSTIHFFLRYSENCYSDSIMYMCFIPIVLNHFKNANCCLDIFSHCCRGLCRLVKQTSTCINLVEICPDLIQLSVGWLQHFCQSKELNVSSQVHNIRVKLILLLISISADSQQGSNCILQTNIMETIVLLLQNNNMDSSSMERKYCWFLLSNLIQDETNETRFVEKYNLLTLLINDFKEDVDTEKEILFEAGQFLYHLLLDHLEYYTNLLKQVKMLSIMQEFYQRLWDDQDSDDNSDPLEILEPLKLLIGKILVHLTRIGNNNEDED